MTEKEKLQEARDLVWDGWKELEWENINAQAIQETFEQKINRWLNEGWKPTTKE
jgi:hypothetical protein